MLFAPVRHVGAWDECAMRQLTAIAVMREAPDLCGLPVGFSGAVGSGMMVTALCRRFLVGDRSPTRRA